MNNFYVYIHKISTTGEVFYIGKGKGDRAKRIKNGKNEKSKTHNGYIFKYTNKGIV